MARKWYLFFRTVQPILKAIFMWKFRPRLATFFLALLTLTFTLVVPVLFPEKVTGTEMEIKPTSLLISQISNALNLEQRGKEYYDIGNFSEASKIWQQAADAYGKDEDGKNKNLINKAKALQSLGLYPEACSQLMPVFTSLNSTCVIEEFKNSDFQNNFIEKIKQKPSSINKIRGLRLLAEILLRLDIYTNVDTVNLDQIADKDNKINLPQKILEITLQDSEKYPEEKSAIMITLANLHRYYSNKQRDQLEYSDIIDFIIQPSKYDFLKLYSQSFDDYEAAEKYAGLNSVSITQTQTILNQFSLLVEIKEWWNEQIKTHKDLLNRRQATLKRQIKQEKIALINISEKPNNSDLESKFKSLIQKKETLLNRVEEDFKNIEIQENNLHNQIYATIKNKVLPKIKTLLIKLPTTREAVYAQINFANSLIRLNNNTNKKVILQQEIPNLSEVANILFKAIQQAHNLGDKQAESQGLSNLARLYELQVSHKENLTKQDQDYLTQAKQLTDQALNLLDDINVDNRQILYRQRHQLGRILRASENIEGALASYAEAWNILQSLRADLVSSADNQFSFRQNVEPVYRDFIDLLLQPASSLVNVEKLVLPRNITGENNLPESKTLKNPVDVARLIMESLQLAELDNFLQKPCSPPIAKPVQIDDISQDTAVIYPIILADRLEVILSLPGQKSSHYHTLINQKVVKTHLEDLSNIIYSKKVEPESAYQIVTTGYHPLDNKKKISVLKDHAVKVKELSKTVYNWLIKPLEPALAKQQIKTLVFVLDRPFQKIPLAALYNGEKYLIENYRIALNIGQQLIDPKPLKRENLKILAAGVSEERTVRGQKFSALPGVEPELNSIGNLGVPTEIILNKDFTEKIFQDKIKSSPNIVHLSTHGIFSSNREKTFILTGNDSIGIDDFQNWLNPQNRISQKAIELLFLSACETASGDEKAALGMAGVVLRSGASSTIATLWPVSDNATARLGLKFYENLITGKASRAEALRNAQLSLIRDNQYKNPFYWAPFILIGNWL
ncbi:CHAT domain-containing protein [Anabaena variabilis FACHB-164]|nr:CHAT domain-containing protein [Trichormus variabilis FACHB-164]